jgi:hypothetical protein
MEISILKREEKVIENSRAQVNTEGLRFFKVNSTSCVDKDDRIFPSQVEEDVKPFNFLNTQHLNDNSSSAESSDLVNFNIAVEDEDCSPDAIPSK